MAKRTFAILSQSIIDEVIRSVETGNTGRHDVRALLEIFCAEASTTEGASLELQRFIAFLIERVLSKERRKESTDRSLGLTGRRGPKTKDFYERDKEICLKIAAMRAEGRKHKDCLAFISEHYPLGIEIVDTIWDRHKVVAFGMYFFERLNAGNPLTNTERERLVKACGRKVFNTAK